VDHIRRPVLFEDQPCRLFIPKVTLLGGQVNPPLASWLLLLDGRLNALADQPGAARDQDGALLALALR